MPSAMRACLLILLCPTLAVAQDHCGQKAAIWRSEDLPKHLAATNATEVAWAAHLVEKRRVAPAVPAVRAALARLAAVDNRPSRIARILLLDALIQMDVRVPAEELLPHAVQSTRAAALVLAAKAPEANVRYFEERFAKMRHDLEWQVCGSLLAALRSREFVAECLTRLQLQIDIRVSDGNRKHLSFSCGLPAAARSEPTEMPPIPFYSLAWRKDPKALKTLRVSFRRVLVKQDADADRSGLPAVDAQRCYRSWLLAFGGRCTREALLRDRREWVRLMSNESLRTIVTRHHRTARWDIRAMLRELRRNGSLRGGTLVQPQITLRLDDNRGKPLWALPSTDWLLGKER